MKIFFLSIISCFFCSFDSKKEVNIFLVPGFMGSRIHLQDLDVQNSHRDFHHVWLSPSDLIFEQCLLKLELNTSASSKLGINNSGKISVIIPDFGGTNSIKYLGGSLWMFNYLKNMADVVNALKKLNYEENVTLFGIPYDFRLVTENNALANYFFHVKKLVTENFKNNNKKAVFICHSMGCPIISLFINFMDRQFRSTYIEGLFIINGAFGGSPTLLKTLYFGEEYIFLKDLISETTKRLSKSFPSLFSLIPRPGNFDEEKVIFRMDSQKFKAKNILEILNILNITNAEKMLELSGTIQTCLPVDVKGFNLYTHGFKTLEKFELKIINKKWVSVNEEFIDGDGKFSISSLLNLKYCDGTMIENLGIKDVDHFYIIHNHQLMSEISNYLNKL